MKTLVVTILLSLSFAVQAQSSKILEMAPKNYLNALNSDCCQMVEAAVFYSVKLNYFHPEIEIKNLAKKIDELSREGKTEVIRYKAYLASYLLNNSDLFSEINEEDYNDSAIFFQNLATILNQRLLAENE